MRTAAGCAIWVLCIAVAACSAPPAGAPVGNLHPLELRRDPQVFVDRERGARLPQARTFSVFPHAKSSRDRGPAEAADGVLLFLLRCGLESRGYEFVEAEAGADLLATAHVSIESHVDRVEARTTKLPRWVPGVTMPDRGADPVPPDADGGTDRRTTRKVTVPAYEVEGYCPIVRVEVFDRERRRVWMGVGVGVSPQADPRLSAQFVLRDTLARFPEREAPAHPDPIGIETTIVTVDGESFLPALRPRDVAGPGLLADDLLLSIDGRPTRNLSWGEVRQLLAATRGPSVTLEVLRPGQVEVVEMPVRDQPSR